MQTILVIDDDDAVREAILLGLEKHSYRCLQGRNGREGVEIARTGGVDLILCDLNLGGTDTSGTFTLVREYAATAGIPFIVMTGQLDQEAEGDDFLVKPFSLAALLEVVRRHLEKKPRHQNQEQLSPRRKRGNRKVPGAGTITPSAEPVLLGQQLSAEELEQILARVQVLREKERKQLARVIHDDLTQTLTVVAIELSLLESNLRSASRGKTTGDHVPTVEKLLGLVNDLIRSAQEITARLHPKVLDEFGLVAALEWLADQATQRMRMKCELLVEEAEVALNPELSAELYRICEELLAHAVRHVRPTAASIRLTRRADTLSIEIKHNGKALEESVTDGAGKLELLAIRKRTERLGGRFALTRIPGEGMAARVTVQIPL